ncbi:Lysophospholipase L1 [Nonomuraea solani]|uniref:Lysophospholipase L1 n=1 Tax=Nonomuraea solani TaxID=1144553 RepID=A0A1H6CXB3_9ACTN|nr:GDSL-type esterase/lipase family protein [Nonomuraea solani]SEG77672.1 Lysophospholipase L1 [Nonomuraea solani]
MKRLIVISLCLLVAAAGLVGYLTFLRPPDNPPAACTAEPTRPRVVAAGDSLTQGSLGANWLAALRAKHPAYEFVNAGINGNTSADLLRRVDSDIVACRPAAVTLLIGTNDVRDDVPLDQYRNNLRGTIERVKAQTGARVALMSLPPLGEDLNTDINRKLTGYNAAIKEIATQANADYLPLHERMAEILREGPRTAYDFSFPLAFEAAAQHYLFQRGWDEIARSGGRELLVDHVHLADRGGAIVADLTTDWLHGL